MRGIDLVRHYLRYVNIRGCGFIEIVMVDEETGEAVIRGYQLWGSAYSIKKGLKMPSDCYYAGAVAGMIKAAFDMDVACRETRCFALGEEYCEFHALPNLGEGNM